MPLTTSKPDGPADGNRFQRFQKLQSNMKSLEDKFECVEQVAMSQISELEDQINETLFLVRAQQSV